MVRYILGSLKSKRELAQQLQSPAALAEGLGLVPHIHMVAQNRL